MELASFALARVRAQPPATAPELFNRDPAPGETGVPRGAAVAFELAPPGGGTLDPWALRVWIDDVVAFDGSSAAPITSAFAGDGRAWRSAAGAARVVLAPQSPFASGATVRVRVTASTSGGARFDATYSFTVEDVARPRLIAAVAIGARTVRLAFDKPVATSTRPTVALEPLSVPAVRGQVTSAAIAGSLVEVTLAAPLSMGVLYQARVWNVADERGHSLNAPGDTARFTAFRPQRPDGRSFGLWSMLPKHNRRLDTSGELQRFIACLQEVTDGLLAELDAAADLPDVERTPEWMLDRVLSDLGNPFQLPLSVLDKRRLASTLITIYRQKGTAPGIRNAVRFFLNLDDIALAPLAATALVLGDSELGEDWELGPSTRFARYAFEVRVGRVLAIDERAALRTLVEYMKPAQTHLVRIAEPATPVLFDDWELGISELGVDSRLH